ncbi:unnamed protein product [Callosobruchus maculatus]|uniref:Peptidase S1 domain-containing protein n=1 Tax=Callosobruchus maculatus TaxID=64391 RepID=A0A653DRU1_CALMS|nr:unnamed protein product [Callosobruchus maculatus]
MKVPMNILVIAFCCISHIWCIQPETNNQTLIDYCMKEAEIGEDIVESYQEDPDKEPTEDYYCYLHCLFTEIGLLSEDGDVVVDVFKTIFDEVDEECLKKLPKITECNDMENFDECDMEKTIFHSSEIPGTSQIKITIQPQTPQKLLQIIDSEEESVFGSKSFALMANNETVQDMHQISIPSGSVKSYMVLNKPKTDKIRVVLEGALLPPYYGNLSKDMMIVWIQLMVMKDVPKPINTSAIRDSDILWLQVPEVRHKKIFHLSSHQIENASYQLIRLEFKTNLESNFPVSMGYNLQPINPDDGVIYAALVLLGLYVLIVFDIIHRTLAAMLASTMSLAILAALNERPTVEEIISWIDMETLILLFSMMILVTIFSETGVFDYTALWALKKTGGSLWPLINMLCVLTALLSCFLDNVTTVLLITPTTIKLCEVMQLNPKQILMFTLIFANIGGAVTPIGDPPNVIIASNAEVIRSGITFGIFTLHMSVGVLLAFLVVYLQIRITYRDMKYYQFDEPLPVQDLKREIEIWTRTANSVGSYSKDEDAVKESLWKKTEKLKDDLKQVVNTSNNNTQRLNEVNLKELEEKYSIKNKPLLIKSGITLSLVICVFFLHSVPALSRLGLGWTALLGALLLFLLYDNQDLEGIFARVEWSTLLFFASLFILMEALSRLGLIDWIGLQTQYVITSVCPESRLAAAIVLILWVSAIASAFVDNLPLTTMMLRIAVNLAGNQELHLPLQPLIWALSFGACLGGNGTLFGSSSNIVCAGLAEQHGYRFTFIQFMKVGLPAMISSTIVVTMYLIFCHDYEGIKMPNYHLAVLETVLILVIINLNVMNCVKLIDERIIGGREISIEDVPYQLSLSFSNCIQPVKLADQDELIPTGAEGIVSGWGTISPVATILPRNLRAATIPVMSKMMCRMDYMMIHITERQFCAGYDFGGRDTCNQKISENYRLAWKIFTQ